MFLAYDGRPRTTAGDAGTQSSWDGPWRNGHGPGVAVRPSRWLVKSLCRRLQCSATNGRGDLFLLLLSQDGAEHPQETTKLDFLFIWKRIIQNKTQISITVQRHTSQHKHNTTKSEEQRHVISRHAWVVLSITYLFLLLRTFGWRSDGFTLTHGLNWPHVKVTQKSRSVRV